MTIEVTLPYPPSANRYWRNYKGRTVVSLEAQAYKQHVGLLMNAAGVEPLTGDVKLSVDIYRPRKAGDLDNRLKIVGDAMNKLAYTDDSQIVEIHARRFDDKSNPRVEVRIEAIS